MRAATGGAAGTLRRLGARFPASGTGPASGNIVLGVQNVVPVERAVAARTLAERAETYADEVRRLVDAAYAVMRWTGSLDPRVSDIVAAAGLSNQAFYRHFRGKDELLVAVLEDGQRRLVATLERRMARAASSPEAVGAWVEGVLEQARNPDAAANTRPFAVNGPRLTALAPVATAAAREQVISPLRGAVADCGGDPVRDADAVYHLAMGAAQDAMIRQETPTREDIQHLVACARRIIGVSG